MAMSKKFFVIGAGWDMPPYLTTKRVIIGEVLGRPFTACDSMVWKLFSARQVTRVSGKKAELHLVGEHEFCGLFWRRGKSVCVMNNLPINLHPAHHH